MGKLWKTVCAILEVRGGRRDGARRQGSEVRTERQREPAEPPERPSGEAGRVPTGWPLEAFHRSQCSSMFSIKMPYPLVES